MDAATRDLIDGVLAGKLRPLAKMMSLAETGSEEARAALGAIHGHTGQAHVVGVTGVPGAGKSTLIAALTRTIRATGRTVGIVAVDPSSPYSGGSILGDRVRMGELSGDDGVFVRAMASGEATGGLARATMDTVDILDAAGFDVVIVETVGVGQDEVDVMRAAQTVVVASPPGLGDVFQAIKAGLVEIADIHAVTKADRPEASDALADLSDNVGLGRHREDAWAPPIVPTSATEGAGLDELLAAIDGHRAHLVDSGALAVRRRRSAEMRILKTAEDTLHRRLTATDGPLSGLLDRVLAGEIDPRAAAEELLAGL